MLPNGAPLEYVLCTLDKCDADERMNSSKGEGRARKEEGSEARDGLLGKVAGSKSARSTAICTDLVYHGNQIQMQNGILDLR